MSGLPVAARHIRTDHQLKFAAYRPVHILEAGSACLNPRCARLEFQRDKRPILGRPLGKTRVRLVNADGPHLHSDWMCAEPRSARMSQVKWLRHIKRVISSSMRGRERSQLMTT